MKHSSIFAIAALALSACATAPNKVQPSMVSQSAYDGLPCPALAQAHASNSASLAKLTKQQRGTRNADIAGVIMLGLPVGRMTGGNVAKELGEAKGREIVIEDAMKRQSCA